MLLSRSEKMKTKFKNIVTYLIFHCPFPAEKKVIKTKGHKLHDEKEGKE